MAVAGAKRGNSTADGGEPAVILFDGDCGFCSRWASFVAARDPRRRFRFLGLASVEGQALLEAWGFDPGNVDTVVLVEDGRVSTHSNAVLRILRRLHAPWPLLYGLVIVPRPIRDAVYHRIAAHRPHKKVSGTFDIP